MGMDVEELIMAQFEILSQFSWMDYGNNKMYCRKLVL
jgi:hypothetical protein